MTFLRDLLAVVVLVLLVFLLGMCAHVVYQVGPSVGPLVRDTHMGVLEATLTLKNLREASDTWEQASKEQSSETTTAMSNVSVAAKQLSQLISSTDKSLNTDLLPTLTEAIRSQNASLLESQKSLQEGLLGTQQASQQLIKTLADADAVIADPAMKETLANAATSSQNLASATADAAGTMKDLRTAADHELAELLKPVNKAKAAILFALQAIGAIKRY